jgi:hypothetical protein
MIEWSHAEPFEFIRFNANKLPKFDILTHLDPQNILFSFCDLLEFFIIESYSQADISKVEKWLPKEVVIFAIYYVAIYNKMSPISNSGPVRNTIIIQVAI